MTRNHKWFSIVVIAIIALSLGAFTVYAQEPGNTPNDNGWGCHYGMGNQHGMRMGMMNGGQPMLTAAAEVLGLEPQVLWEELRSGKTLAEIAEAQGIELAEVEAALLTFAEAHMALMVENGHMTQAQVDEMLTDMQENMENHFNSTFKDGMGMQHHNGRHGGHYGRWGW